MRSCFTSFSAAILLVEGVWLIKIINFTGRGQLHLSPTWFHMAQCIDAELITEAVRAIAMYYIHRIERVVICRHV